MLHEVRGQLVILDSLPRHVDPWDQTEVISFGSKGLYPVSHYAGPVRDLPCETDFI